MVLLRDEPRTGTGDWRREGLILGDDPDAKVPFVHFPAYWHGESATHYLPVVESGEMARVAAGLIERNPAALGQAGRISIAFLWSKGVGLVQGDERLWRLRKPTDEVIWALNSNARAPRHLDLLFEMSAHVALLNQWTRWQEQAAIHEALLCIQVRQGRVSIKPPSLFIRQLVIRRYGDWAPDLVALKKAMELAESEQLPLWEEGWDEGEDE